MRRPRQEIGAFCLVLHTHLPWLAHHGSWPVGEEWLHQSWATAYQRVAGVLAELAAEGRRDLLTLGITPILAAQLDDPYCLREHHTWLGFWRARAEGMAASPEPWRREHGRYEFAQASHALTDFERHWSRGSSSVWRALADTDAIELLGGPLAHSFTPLLPDRLAHATLSLGLDDAALRLGRRPRGIWAPECAYAPGLEHVYSDVGVSHVVVDGPTLLHVGASTAQPWLIGESDVVAFGRDLEVSYRVWSPRRGYPGDPWYRDFHTFDHDWGFRPMRVTGRNVPPEEKKPYDPERAAQIARRDADDFIEVVRRRLEAARAQDPDRTPLVVAAYDTELFGHWWHEGPLWLAHVLRGLPEAGVRLTTLRHAADLATDRVFPEPGSWGSGKDWRVWTGSAVDDIVDRQGKLTKECLAVLDITHPRTHRSIPHDQLMRELVLALSSDWAFMITKDSAAHYARERFRDHADAAERLARLIESHGHAGAQRLAASLMALDDPFGGLDARRFLTR